MTTNPASDTDPAAPTEDADIIPIRHRSIPTWDRRDYELVRAALDARRALPGPLVGDWIQFTDRTLRITYVWGDEAAQTESGNGSIHLASSGHGTYSGSLYRSVPVPELTATDQFRLSQMWIFHHGCVNAHNSVQFTIPTRIYTINRHSPN
jgi:hypothetical protein